MWNAVRVCISSSFSMSNDHFDAKVFYHPNKISCIIRWNGTYHIFYSNFNGLHCTIHSVFIIITIHKLNSHCGKYYFPYFIAHPLQTHHITHTINKCVSLIDTPILQFSNWSDKHVSWIKFPHSIWQNYFVKHILPLAWSSILFLHLRPFHKYINLKLSKEEEKLKWITKFKSK